MPVIYSIINFVILFGLLAFICRKLIPEIFRKNRRRIVDDLKSAQEAEEQADSIEKVIDSECRETEENKVKIIEDAEKRAVYESHVSKRRAYRAATTVLDNAKKEQNRLEQDMKKRVRTEAMQNIAKQTAQNLKKDEYKAEKEKLSRSFHEQIRDLITVMPSDRIKMESGSSSDAVISSAEALSEEEKQNIEGIIKDKFSDVVCKYEVREDVVGGIRLQIGDTVYDGTIGHSLSRIADGGDVSSEYPEDDAAFIQSIKEDIEKAGKEIDVYQAGKVISLGDGIARVSGLSDCVAGEMLLFPHNVMGMAQDLDTDNVGAVLLGECDLIQEGDEVRRTGKIVSVPVGDEMIGRVVNALGQPIDGKGAVNTTQSRPVESPSPSVMDRKRVSTPLQTGIKAIDALVPIGRGQRELIIGDRQTGKTAIAVDTIINQKNKDVICIYVAIGQKESTVAGVVETLTRFGAMDYSIIVNANASEPAPMLYIAPYAGAAIGEYFMHKGKDVLIIYDDLSKHAVAYRELSLLLQRPPGREAYPGDVFYLHSRLLERAARLSDELGGGSMTALPIIETQVGDISAYIPTNVISITDGQIFLETDLFHSGIRPAINVGLSVSRVGGDAQLKAMKQFAGRLRMELAQYRELSSFAQFGSDLDKSTQDTLIRGAHMTELLKQEQYRPMPVSDQLIIIYAGSHGLTDSIPVQDLDRFEKGLISYVNSKFTELSEMVLSGNKLNTDVEERLKQLIEEYRAAF